MSDYRYQPLTDQWILIAADREIRPNDYRPRHEYAPDRPCPFCIGHEPDTPEAIAFYPAGSGLGEWLVRVVPNKFPALKPTPTETPRRTGPWTEFRGFGLHELVVLSPRHVESYSELDGPERGTSFVAFQDRIRLAWTWPDIRHAVLFQNCRVDAGASIRHVHSQLIATAVVPPEIARRHQRQQSHREATGQTLLESIVADERREQGRVVLERDGFVAFCPYASRLSYELWIAPDEPSAEPFEGLTTERLGRLADLLHAAVIALEGTLPGIAYNFVIHLPPRVPGETSSGHWWIELFPRINKLAGFELATGCMINQVPPDIAAGRLRDHIPAA